MHDESSADVSFKVYFPDGQSMQDEASLLEYLPDGHLEQYNDFVEFE
jgi:hypothetical protein